MPEPTRGAAAGHPGSRYAAAGHPGRFRLATPATWFDLDVGPGANRHRVKATVEARVKGDHPRQVELRRQLTDLLDRSRSEAAANGAVFCSVYAGSLEASAMSASLLASVGSLGPFGRDGSALDLRRLRAALVAAAGRPTTITGSEVVDLVAGPAVRLRKRTVATVLERSVECDVVQYVIPAPTVALGARRALTLTFSTPTLVVADTFAGLFDTIAASLRWR